MNIKWNEVTWYSKLLSVIFLLGGVPVLTFYIGMQYEAATAAADNQPSQVAVSSAASDPSFSGWKTYVNPAYGFSVQYPAGAVAVDSANNEGAEDVLFQRLDSQGNVSDDLLGVSIAKNFWMNGKMTPVTNCDDVAAGDPGDSPSYININGVPFQKYVDPASYDEENELAQTEYCAFHNGTVYNLSLSKIYDSAQVEAGIDDPTLDPVLNQMAWSFKFK